MDRNPEEIVSRIAQAIYDKKGIHIIAIDVRGISTITDFIVIAEGNVDRHVIAIAQNIQKELFGAGEGYPAYAEGLQNGDWIVLDYIQVMVHLFVPGLREKYQLERLWSQGKLMELDLKLSPQTSDSLFK
jgi:ribosome-associated protein